MENTFWSKKDFQENVFFFYGKYFLKVVKNLEILYYFLIISNLILKLLIDIYFVWIFFLISSLLKIWFNLIFILILILIFMIVIYFSLIIFLIEIYIYIYKLRSLFFFIVSYFIWNNLWNCNYYYFNFIIF
jgi:hypothetical protein